MLFGKRENEHIKEKVFNSLENSLFHTSLL